jgi:hypothetical protein
VRRVEMTGYDPKDWFEDTPVIGAMKYHDFFMKLEKLGDYGTIEKDDVIIANDIRGFTLCKPKPWMHTSHAFGFIPPKASPRRGVLEIIHAGNMKPDQELKSSKIRVTLDRLRVFDYPGGGTHNILVDFYAQDQLAGITEHLHYNQIYRVRQGEQAGVIGYPIFVGLHVVMNELPSSAIQST